MKRRLPAVLAAVGMAALAASPTLGAAAKPHGKLRARRVQSKSVHAASSKLTPMTPAQLARLVLPSVVRLTVLDASGQPSVQGSGFVVGPNLIATNVHVVRGAHAVTANFQSGRSETVFGVVSVDNSRDLVLLYANTNGIHALPLMTDNTVQVGDPVVAVGSPEGYGGSMSTGIVSQIRRDGDTKILQTTAPISHGSSGGALIDMYGRVLGVTSFFNTDGQNLNFAYAAYYVQHLIPHGLPVYMSWAEEESYLEKHSIQTADAPASQPPAPTPADNEQEIKALTDDIAQTQTQIDACNVDIVAAGRDESATQTQIASLQQDVLALDTKWRNLSAQADADHDRSIYASQEAQQAEQDAQEQQQRAAYSGNNWATVLAGAAAGSRVGRARREASRYLNDARQEITDANAAIAQENADNSQIETLKLKLQTIQANLAALNDKSTALQSSLDAKNQSMKEIAGN